MSWSKLAGLQGLGLSLGPGSPCPPGDSAGVSPPLQRRQVTKGVQILYLGSYPYLGSGDELRPGRLGTGSFPFGLMPDGAGTIPVSVLEGFSPLCKARVLSTLYVQLVFFFFSGGVRAALVSGLFLVVLRDCSGSTGGPNAVLGFY